MQNLHETILHNTSPHTRTAIPPIVVYKVSDVQTTPNGTNGLWWNLCYAKVIQWENHLCRFVIAIIKVIWTRYNFDSDKTLLTFDFKIIITTAFTTIFNLKK